jgi:hypothetical protein
MDKLVLSYRYDPSYFDKTLDRDDFGRLSLRVETEHFTGEGSFWVQWQDVVEYAQSLDVYPIEADKPIVTQWGYGMQEGEDLIIRISIGAKNIAGDLLVLVVVADDNQPSQRLSASFRSGYSALDMFMRDIARMMNREIPEAVLHGY